MLTVKQHISYVWFYADRHQPLSTEFWVFKNVLKIISSSAYDPVDLDQQQKYLNVLAFEYNIV